MNEELRRKRNKIETPVITKLIILQLFCSLIIILILFFISKSDGGVSKNIKSFYTDIQKTDMSVTEVLTTFKNSAKETFVPVKVPISENGENMGE